MPDLIIKDSFNSPDSKLRGICWDGANFWVVCDTVGDRRIYKVASDGTVISSFALPANSGQPWGITWDGVHLWHSTKLSPIPYPPYLFEFQTDGTVVNSHQLFYWLPRGICWDGTYFWYTDNSGGSIAYRALQIDGNGNHLADWMFEDTEDYEAIEFYDSHLWTTKPSAFSLQKRLTDGTIVSTQTYPDTIIQPSGLAWDGANWWIANRDDDIVYKLGPPLGEDAIAMWVDSKQIPFAAATFDGALYIKRRSDSPATWNNAILIDNSSSAGYSNPGIVMTDDGRIIVTALDGDEATVDAAYVTFYSDDFGTTWTGPV